MTVAFDVEDIEPVAKLLGARPRQKTCLWPTGGEGGRPRAGARPPTKMSYSRTTLNIATFLVHRCTTAARRRCHVEPATLDGQLAFDFVTSR